MTGELGQFALALALAVAAFQAVIPLVGARAGDVGLMRFARPAASMQFACLAAAFAAQIGSFYANDFSILNVAQHSNSKLPLAYRIAASWGSHEGSLLLWAMLLGGWTFAFAMLSRRLPLDMVSRVIGVLGAVSTGFLLFTLFTSNPFLRLATPPADGRDLNPLLQDPGMVFHPPLLYMGYVGFSVAFAFACAALMAGRIDPAWARFSRPWTVAAWSFLSLGIALGSFWAYYELGWGGWWFWDPVENASFMPWLAGTALIHSLAVTEKRGTMKSWTLLLAILTFSLSLLGTFLVRSGVLTSVHAFATDPTRGIFVLALLASVSGTALVLYMQRAGRMPAGPAFGVVSRESMLLANNILLVVALAAVMIGTLYPLAVDALGYGKISVGPPYFEAVFVPLMAPAIALMALGPIVSWRNDAVPSLARRLKLLPVLAILATIAALAAAGRFPLWTALGLALGFWVAAAVGWAVWVRIARTSGGFLARLTAQRPSWYGMHLAHFGIAVFVLAVTSVKSFQLESEVVLKPGDSTQIAGYTLKWDGLTEVPGPNYVALRARFGLTDPENRYRELHPEKRKYFASGQAMTEAAIDRSLTRDIYVSLGEPSSESELNGPWVVRVQYKPFVNWIWLGVLMMALGGLFTIFDRRYRVEATGKPA